MQQKILNVLTHPMTAWEIADKLDQVDPNPCGYTYKIGWYLWYSIEQLLKSGKIRFKEEIDEPQPKNCILFSKDLLLKNMIQIEKLQNIILNILTRPMYTGEIIDEINKINPHPCEYSYKTPWYVISSLEILLKNNKIKFTCSQVNNDIRPIKTLLFLKYKFSPIEKI